MNGERDRFRRSVSKTTLFDTPEAGPEKRSARGVLGTKHLSNVLRRRLLSVVWCGVVSDDSGWIACRHRVLRGLISIVHGEHDNINRVHELLWKAQGAIIAGPVQRGRNQPDLASEPRSSSKNKLPIKLNDPLVALGDVVNFLVSPDSSRVVYRADQDWASAPGQQISRTGVWLRFHLTTGNVILQNLDLKLLSCDERFDQIPNRKDPNQLAIFEYR